jgi:hypothetical protein
MPRTLFQGIPMVTIHVKTLNSLAAGYSEEDYVDIEDVL